MELNGKIPKGRRIIVLGFTKTCQDFVRSFKDHGCDIYAYASDDLVFVENKNMNNIILCEKNMNKMDTEPIPIYSYYEAIEMPGVFYVLATDYYEKLLKESGFIKGYNYYRIGR